MGDTPTCGIAGCNGGHYPQDHNEIAALRAELEAERSAGMNDWRTRCLASEAERDRYRDALERIATPGHPFMHVGREEAIAKQALNGGDDE